MISLLRMKSVVPVIGYILIYLHSGLGEEGSCRSVCGGRIAFLCKQSELLGLLGNSCDGLALLS